MFYRGLFLIVAPLARSSVLTSFDTDAGTSCDWWNNSTWSYVFQHRRLVLGRATGTYGCTCCDRNLDIKHDDARRESCGERDEVVRWTKYAADAEVNCIDGG